MTKAKEFTMTASAVIAVVAVEFLGGYDKLLQALLLFIVIDYGTGIARAIRQGCLSSKIGMNGIVKKIGLLCMVAVANQLDAITGQALIRSITIAFYVGNEGLSILENLKVLDVPIPNAIKKALEKIKKEDEDK